MNLLFRLFCVLAFWRRRSRLGILDECRTPFRVFPTDLDPLRHMNNGKYFSLQDLARLDLMLRTGSAKPLGDRGWFGVVASETLRFRKSLTLFQRFEIVTRVLTWDEKSMYLEHQFVCGRDIVALGLVRVRFLQKSGGTVSPIEALALMGAGTAPPPSPDYLTHWIESEAAQARALVTR